MGKIVLLDDLTINQIAAGEVIERPASVVKELVENSIDAGAKNVIVDIKNGGISYIRITDDGSGIMPDDMEIAFERHATSKIRKAEDLDEVKSMGFRGEALASIAAIAKIDLLSKAIGQQNGYEIVLEGGNIKDKHEAGCAQGTSITVTELFYNTPVRYKFLKKDFTETGYIEEAVQRIALANPEVSIKLIDSGKITIQTTGSGKLVDTVYSIFGKEIVENILPVDYTYEDLHISGVIGKPIISRSNRTNQLFYVNHRFIKDKTLTSAAEQGFKGLVTIGKHGFLILNIDMDPKKVDVNVHPTKLEVRFQEESKVFKAVYHSIKETLLKCDLVSDPEKDYSDITPNDMLKNIRNNSLTNRARVEAWGLGNTINKTSEPNGLDKDIDDIASNEQNKLEEALKKSDNYGDLTEKDKNALDTVSSNAIKQFNETKKPEYREFKSTIASLDEETRKKFIDEVTKAKTPEELIKGLDNFTNLAKMNNEAKSSTAINGVEVNSINENANEKNSEVKLDNLNEQGEAQLKEDKKIQEVDIENADKTEIGNIQKAVSENANETENKNLQITGDSNINKVTDAENEITENVEVDGKEESKNGEELNQDVELSFEEMFKKLFGRNVEDAQKEYNEKIKEEDEKYPISPITNNEISMFEKNGVDKNPPYNFVGIAFKTYIILTMGEDLYILDQHAAHERIMYEKVKANYYSNDEKDSQLMLLPDIINLNNREMGIFRDNKEMFNKAGFVVDEFGDNTVKLTGVPEFCLDFNTKEIFLETLDEIDTVARTAKQEVEDKFLATVACKAAVKAHMALTKEEVDSLMSQLLKLPNPFSCPHGRPTVIKMSKIDIEKKFSRR